MSIVKKIPKYLVIDGEIGSGKSTLTKALAEYLTKQGLKVCVVLEPVEEWRKVGILKRFYENRRRYAYEMQTFTYVTRIQSTRQLFEQHPEADVYLLERTILTDRFIFMELQRDVVDEGTFQMYNQWCDLFKHLMPFDLSQAHYIYLKPSLVCCMERIHIRAREEEVFDSKDGGASTKGGVTLDYQSQLRLAHEALFEGKHESQFPVCKHRPFPLSSVLVIDETLANQNFSPTGKDREEIVKTIVQRLEKT